MVKKLQNKIDLTFGNIAKWMLLGFIIVTITIVLLKIFESPPPSSNSSLYEQLAPWKKDQQMVLLFHFTERCAQCLNMEKFTNDVLNEDYPELVADKDLQFKLVTIDQPENVELVKRFDLYTATIALVRFDKMEEKWIVILRDIWKYSQDESVFKDSLRKELLQFVNQYE